MRRRVDAITMYPKRELESGDSKLKLGDG